MKVVGIIKPDTKLKDFEIGHNGNKYLYERHGSRWKIGEQVFETLALAKQAVLDGLPDEPEPPAELETNAEPSHRGVWDCVDPCALLALGMFEGKEAYQTLDAYGWIDPQGVIDTDRARRMLQRFGLPCEPEQHAVGEI